MNSLTLTLAPEHQHLNAAHTLDTWVVARLEGAPRADRARAPLDLVACLDVSGSMQGQKLALLTASVERLGRELGAQDRLAVVTFSDRAAVAAPPLAMDAAGKQQLGLVLARLTSGGSTAMAFGLEVALDTLRRSPPVAPNTLRRVLLFTDGHANVGLDERDRGGWARLLETERREATVSWFGYGEDHDPLFLSWLADHSGGNAYAAKDTDAMADAFARELGGLLGTAALDVTVRVSCPRGGLRLLNDERHEHDGDAVVVHLADVGAEERRALVFSWRGPALKKATAVELSASATWTEVLTRQPQACEVMVAVAVGEGPEDASSAAVLEAVVLQVAAVAQKKAQALAEGDDLRGANAVLNQALVEVSRFEVPGARQVLQVLDEAKALLRDRQAYRSSRAQYETASRSMNKQKPTGSRVDRLYSTPRQEDLAQQFVTDTRAGRARKP